MRLAWAICLPLALSYGAAAQDARAIIQKSVENDQWNWEHARNYTFHERQVRLERGRDGSFHDPRDSRAKILPKLRAKLWIDKQSYDGPASRPMSSRPSPGDCSFCA